MINHKCSDPASTDATSGVFEAKSNTEDLLELKLEQIFPPEWDASHAVIKCRTWSLDACHY